MSTGEQEPHGFTEFLASVDVVVIGRRTFDVVRKLGHLELYGKKPLIVLSGRPPASKTERKTGLEDKEENGAVQGAVIEQMSGEPPEIVKQLTARGFQHAYIDGGITIQRFLAAGCIHRMVITRVPVLIGTGIPLFGPVPRDITLRHVATHTYPGGLVQTEYEFPAAESPH